MSKFEITIKADELIAALTKLAAALESKQIEYVQGPAVVATVESAIAKVDTPNIEQAMPNPAPITIEQVRAVLAEKSQSGKQPHVKALITKFGAKKLTDIDPARYTELLKEAEVL
jgi:hypothetical protein